MITLISRTWSPRLTISSHSSYLAAGLAAATGSMADALVDGYAYGSLSMTAFTLDADCSQRLRSGHAAPLPSPDLVPTDDTNT